MATPLPAMWLVLWAGVLGALGAELSFARHSGSTWPQPHRQVSSGEFLEFILDAESVTCRPVPCGEVLLEAASRC
ncbi:hypothetical protein TSOC_010010, partial [Tetrabaena socialis]